ncbi:TatD family domain-containing protein [Rozella allomycis CSF55]|uniref:TatD family domain-containing protein n=1 Tax=Rozella allomycis (strain CSF55) TaxID=988480 RepID=A0A075AMX2_ROZAC|nr:TatD family domain-containing protein [Rozella allomycis CSF55]|eukprot:EPZ31064.1 TatD family domain-containing protein [Rozella allomycis CSF55]
MFFDCHCHLVNRYFSKEAIDTILKRCANDIHLVCVAENEDDFDELLQLKAQNCNISICLGLHPIQAEINNDLQIHRSICEKDWEKIQFKFADCLHTSRCDGIGEIGLDFSPHIFQANKNVSIEKQKEDQLLVFKKQLELAKKFDLFVNVHSRQAGHYAIEVLEEYEIRRCILHAFDGKFKYALRACANGWFLSIPGNVKRSDKFQKMARELPLENILIESDAPALSAFPGERSSPLDVIDTLNFVAELRKIDKNTLMRQIEANFARLTSKSYS